MAFDYGFLILSPEHNVARVKSTLASIELHYSKTPSVCVVNDTANAGDLKEFNKLCPTYQGGATLTSLVNAGMRHGGNRWTIILMEGVWLNKNIDRKLSLFAKNELDILFPIFIRFDVDGKPMKCFDFVSAPLNGLTVHQSTFLDVGDFTDNPQKIAKQLWYDKAVKQGIAFKGILGARIC
jgi:hypothetical protein